MKIARSDGTTLLVKDSSIVWGVVLFASSAFCVHGIVHESSAATRQTGLLISLSITAAVLFILGVLLCRTARFEFDLVGREMRWRGVLGRSATIPFEQIIRAVVETTSSDGSTCYRIALMRRDGGAWPLTYGYTCGSATKYEAIRDAINEAIGVADSDTSSSAEDDIARLAAQGHKLQAIALTRRLYDVSLTEAKQYVDALQVKK